MVSTTSAGINDEQIMATRPRAAVAMRIAGRFAGEGDSTVDAVKAVMRTMQGLRENGNGDCICTAVTGTV